MSAGPSGRWLVAVLLGLAGALPVLLPLVALLGAAFGLVGINSEGPAFVVGLVLYLAGVHRLAFDPRCRWRCPVWPTDR